MSPNRRPKGGFPAGGTARRAKAAPVSAPGRSNARIPQHAMWKEAP